MTSGYYEHLLRYYGEANDIVREQQDAPNLSIGLCNESGLLVFLGRLSEARRAVSEALRLATEEDSENGIRDSHSYRGWAASVSGQLSPAALDFALANGLEKKNDPTCDELYGLRGVWWAELLLRSGHPALATRRTEANVHSCERNQWNDDIARCHSMLGWCALAEGRLDDAESGLRQAEPILRRGQLLFDLARLHR